MGQCVSKHKKSSNLKFGKLERAKIEGYSEVQRYLKNRDNIPHNYIYLLLNGMNFKPNPKKNDKVQNFLRTFKIAKLSLRDLELDEFDFHLPSTLRTLDLAKNKISKLSVIVLKATHLKKLSLKQNSFESIPNKISKLKHLETLILKENKIKEFTKKPFIGLSIKRIDLSHNLIEELAISLDHLPGLEFLDLSNNEIKFIDDKLFRNTHRNLCFLSLRNNLQLSSIPENINNCIELSTLKIDNTKMKVLPLSLGTLNYLTCIELSHQIVTKPPSYISVEGTLRIKEYLKRQIQKKENKVDSWEMFLDFATHKKVNQIILKNLDFDHSDDDPTIFELNEILEKYIQLKKLSIQSCKLSSIPYTVPKDVTNLILKDNLIKEVPKVVIKESKFAKLDLSSNKIQTLYIKKADELSILNLSDNLIETIHKKCFLMMPKLKFLNLSQNRINNLDIKMSQLENLAVLNLSMNVLTTIPKFFFNIENFKLLTLLLNDNKLLAVPTSIHKLKALEYLDLQNNEITHLPRQLLEMESIEKITIHSNFFHYSVKELTKQNMAQFPDRLIGSEKHDKEYNFDDEEEEKQPNLEEVDEKSMLREDKSEINKHERNKSAVDKSEINKSEINKHERNKSAIDKSEINKSKPEVPIQSFFNNSSEVMLNKNKQVSIKQRKRFQKVNRIQAPNNKKAKTHLLENPAYANTLRVIEDQKRLKEHFLDLFYEESNASNILSCLQTMQDILLKVLPKNEMRPRNTKIPILSYYYSKRIANYRAALRLLKFAGFYLASDSTHQDVLQIKFYTTKLEGMNSEDKTLLSRVEALKNSIGAITKIFSIDKDRDELKSDDKYFG